VRLRLELGRLSFDLHIAMRDSEPPRVIEEDATVKILNGRRF